MDGYKISGNAQYKYRDKVLHHGTLLFDAYLDRLAHSKAERQAIKALADARYRRWEWNFGHSPAYNFAKTVHTPVGALEVDLHVRKGIIRSIRIDGRCAADVQSWRGCSSVAAIVARTWLG